VTMDTTAPGILYSFMEAVTVESINCSSNWSFGISAIKESF